MLPPLGEIDPRLMVDLGARLRAAGLGPSFLSRALRGGERLDDALRAPMRKWTLRRVREPAAIAMRMWTLRDPVTRAEARQVLDPDPYIAAGLLRETEEGIASPFVLGYAGDLYVLADDTCLGGEAVMGALPTTLQLLSAVRGGGRVKRALDLGCGAGTLALALEADEVVATDVSERAVRFGRLNAALNGKTIDFRVGSLGDPIAGERFDLAVCQPPFVPRAEGVKHATYMHGGPRGDEIARAMIQVVRAHADRALLMIDWGTAPDVRSIVKEGSVLVLESPPRPLEDHCALMAAAQHPELGPAFEKTATAIRDHLEAIGVRSLVLTLIVLGKGSFTSTVKTRYFVDAPVTPPAIERLVAARERIEKGDLGDLALCPGAVVRELEGRAIVQLPADRLVAPVVVEPEDLPALKGGGDRRSKEKLLLAGVLEVSGR
jgi:methylase of polypeptide subunit release factors